MRSAKSKLLHAVWQLCLLFTASAQQCGRVYTSNSDWDEGVATNLDHDQVAGELRLTNTLTQANFIWIPASGLGTMVRIDTQTGTVYGEYQTHPDGMYLKCRRAVYVLSGRNLRCIP